MDVDCSPRPISPRQNVGFFIVVEGLVMTRATTACTVGPGNVNDAGNYTNIWHKINGQWRVALHALVSSKPISGRS